MSATKWLAELELTTLEAFDGYWVPLGWAKEAPILTQSRIDTPAAASGAPPAGSPIAGIAWAPDRGISKVEVAIDGAWQRVHAVDADLGRDLGPVAVRLGHDGVSPASTRSRSGRPTGPARSRPISVTPPAPDGARGHDTITVMVAA